MPPLFRQCKGLIEVGCWAHARRKFFEAKETNLALGMEVLARIQLLYEVEDHTKELSVDE
jgi:transposase